MPGQPWTPQTLVIVDDAYDKANASDGHSRYGAYLKTRARVFTEWEPDPLPLDEFAHTAWSTAAAPVMVPGYVRIRPDLTGVALDFDDDGALFARVTVPLQHRDLTARLPHTLRQWQTAPAYGEDGPYRHHEEPGMTPGGLVVLASTEVRVPIPDAALPEPTHLDGPGLVDDARAAVAAVAELVNREAGPVVAALRREGR